MAQSWMLSLLSQQTQQYHAAADGDRLLLIEKPAVDRYRNYLAQIYWFEAPVERALIATDGIPPQILRTHLKSRRLVDDLGALRFEPGALVPLEVPPFESRLDALAWLWVLHRNTLLHGLIYRYLQGRLPAVVSVAGSYLAAFEGRAGALMRDLGDVLDTIAKRISDTERIVASAKHAFRSQRQWHSCDVLSPQHPATAHVLPRASSAFAT